MWGLKLIVFSFLFLYRAKVPLMLMGSTCKKKIITMTGVSHPLLKEEICWSMMRTLKTFSYCAGRSAVSPYGSQPHVKLGGEN